MRPKPFVACFAVLCAALASCVSGEWRRTLVNQPLSEELLADLPQEGVPLARCLTLLGAPTFVGEHRVHGLILAWGWQKDRSWGGQVTGPSQETTALRFSYDDVRLRQPGIALWFDDEWNLTGWRMGYLRDLVGGRPPATVEDIYE